jgi:hypothetical protein
MELISKFQIFCGVIIAAIIVVSGLMIRQIGR